MTQLTVTMPIVNETLFQQANIPLPGPKATWQEWAAATKAVNPNAAAINSVPCCSQNVGGNKASGGASGGSGPVADCAAAGHASRTRAIEPTPQPMRTARQRQPAVRAPPIDCAAGVRLEG